MSMGSLYAQAPDTVGLSEVPAFTEHWYSSQMSTPFHTNAYVSGVSGFAHTAPRSQPLHLTT
eukprot:1840278-Prorocentrum_lima.AAC.1